MLAIPARNASVLKKRPSLNSSIIFKTRKRAAWNPVEDLVTTARCVAREGFRELLVVGCMGRIGPIGLMQPTTDSLYLFWFCLKDSEFNFGTSFAASSALKYGSSLNPKSFAETTVGKLALVVL